MKVPSNVRRSNKDWDPARELEAAALAKRRGRYRISRRPPEFRTWLDALRRPGISTDDSEAVYDAMYDYFGATALLRP